MIGVGVAVVVIELVSGDRGLGLGFEVQSSGFGIETWGKLISSSSSIPSMAFLRERVRVRVRESDW